MHDIIDIRVICTHVVVYIIVIAWMCFYMYIVIFNAKKEEKSCGETPSCMQLPQEVPKGVVHMHR